MSFHDYVIENQSGLNFRADLNNALQAIVTLNSSATEPTATFAYMLWVDTSGAFGVLKQRNAANNAWIEVGRTDRPGWGLGGATVSATEPTPSLAFQYWIDTGVTFPTLRIRNEANTAWVEIGRVDLPNYGALLLTGGIMSAAIQFSNTDHTFVPVGNTGQRPVTPATGMIRFNTTLTAFEGYNGTAWSPIGGGGFAVSAVQSITAGGEISSSTVDQRQMRLIQGNAAPVTASITPFGVTGGWRDGTEILLVGNDMANTVLLTYNDAAKGLVGNFSTIELARFTNVLCVYSQSFDRWIVRG